MQEIVFAQRLADNEKKIRDRALKKLRQYLDIKSSCGKAISLEESLKLWKGLFYCMYMADKPLVQECVAEDISSLIHYVNNESDCADFVRAGFLTFAREWNGIDVFRIDKYMMFVRRFLRHIFNYLRTHEWNMKMVMTYVSILEETVVCPSDDVNTTSLGLKTHVCEIILEELAKAGGENLQHPVIMAVIQPYFKVLALTKIKAYAKFVREGIIHYLIRQTLCEGEEEEEESEDQEQVSEKDVVMEDAGTEGDEEIPVSLDPRAGRVDTFIPCLKVDLGLVADCLQKVGSLSRVPAKNREVIYRLVCELRDAAQGHDPLALPQDNVADVEVPETEVDKAVERLQKFDEAVQAGELPEDEEIVEDNIKVVKKKKRLSKYQKRKALRLKMKQQKTKQISKSKKRKLDKQLRVVAQKRASAVDHMVRQVNTACGISRRVLLKSAQKQVNTVNGFEVSSLVPKKNAGSELKDTANNFTVEVTPRINDKRKGNENKDKSKKKKCFDVSPVDVQQNETPEITTVKDNSENSITRTESDSHDVVNNVQPAADEMKQTNGTTEPLPSISVEGPPTRDEKMAQGDVTSGKQNEKQGGALMHNGDAKTVVDDIKADKQSDQKSEDKNMEVVKNEAQGSKAIVVSTLQSNKKKRLNSLVNSQKKSPWDEPLKKGEYEIVIKSRKHAAAKNKKKKISPIKKRLQGSVPKQRTISINLKENKEQEFSDYVRSLKASPSIPFRADQMPKAPVLKPSPSPILIKGPLMRRKLQKKAAASASPLLFHKRVRQTASDFF